MCHDHPNRETGLRVLNVGFGLGIVGVPTSEPYCWCSLVIRMQIDSYFQALPVPPSTHVIIEPHPDVLRHMREQGWHDKKGVKVLEGKWQDFVGTEVLEGMAFDAVYTDTFSEDYGGEAQHPYHGTLNSASKICANFSIMFQNSSPVQTPDLASSTVWERPVCLPTYITMNEPETD